MEHEILRNMKVIDTGAVKITVLKIPKYTTGWAVGNGAIYFSPVGIKLPPGNYEPLGIADQLTEEQCREVMPQQSSWGKLYYMIADQPNSFGESVTAKEAFASLMKAHGCYSSNPYGEWNETKMRSTSTQSELERRRSKWQQAEANTGPYFILKNIL